MIVYMDQYKDRKLEILKEVHEKVKEALDHEPIQVETVEEAAAWCTLNELDIALDDMFPGEK